MPLLCLFKTAQRKVQVYSSHWFFGPDPSFSITQATSPFSVFLADVKMR